MYSLSDLCGYSVAQRVEEYERYVVTKMSEDPPKAAFKWRHPQEVMQLHQLKKKKRALQARINATTSTPCNSSSSTAGSSGFSEKLSAGKRKNPFLANTDSSKRPKPNNFQPDESSDQTLFKLLHLSAPKEKENFTSFNNLFGKASGVVEEAPIVKVVGEKWVPIDWMLKTKVRFFSSKPFAWSQKLKISEEASGVTSFTRCLDSVSDTSSLDTSPNARFHQCCLYWQQPSLPWMNLFPRTTSRAAAGASVATTKAIRESLHNAWSDSLRSLFQLIRTRQCPYFYACANNFTVLFRAAGISGFTETHALITPTTRGFRHMLRHEEIEFTMPLKKRVSDAGYDTLDSASSLLDKDDDDEEKPDEEWLESMGINSEDIKQINYTQERITQRAECEVDNSEQSLVLVEGPEVQALYGFLIHCKSAIALTGPYAGIPPTLVAPVAFTGASLTGLKVRESKVHLDNEDFYSLDLSGPILPHTIHNLCALHPADNSMTATFSNLLGTSAFSKVIHQPEKVQEVADRSTTVVFGQENLSDCGLMPKVLKQFCSEDTRHVTNFECLKYTAENNSYSWS